jgi:hypothetical protein
LSGKINEIIISKSAYCNYTSVSKILFVKNKYPFRTYIKKRLSQKVHLGAKSEKPKE